MDWRGTQVKPCVDVCDGLVSHETHAFHCKKLVIRCSNSDTFVGEIELEFVLCQIRDNGLDSVAGYPPTQMSLFDHHSSGADGPQHIITGPVSMKFNDTFRRQRHTNPTLSLAARFSSLGARRHLSPPVTSGGKNSGPRQPPSEFPDELTAPVLNLGEASMGSFVIRKKIVRIFVFQQDHQITAPQRCSLHGAEQGMGGYDAGSKLSYKFPSEMDPSPNLHRNV